jgi:hypothetical protein
MTPDDAKRQQAEQIFTQIYQYMNERHSVIGYLITDQELICVPRIPEDGFGLRYGVIDISPSTNVVEATHYVRVLLRIRRFQEDVGASWATA